MKHALDDVVDLVGDIRPLLAGRDPDIVGAALIDLVATFLAGHSPDWRDEMKRLFIAAIDDMVPVIVEELIRRNRFPPDWREETKQ